MRFDGSRATLRDVADPPLPLSDWTMLVDPFSERDVPVVVAVDPRAFEVVVAPVDFAPSTGVGLASGFIAGIIGALSITAGADASGPETGAALGACSVGTFSTTIAELADADGAKLEGASFDCRASGTERSIFGDARDAGGAACTGVTGTAGAGAAAFAGVAGFAGAVDFTGAAARVAGPGAAGLAGS